MVCCPKCKCKRFRANDSYQDDFTLVQTCSCDSCGTTFQVTYELAVVKVERADYYDIWA